VLFALIGAGIAIATLLSQTKSFRLTIGADLAMKLDERFNEASFLQDRAHAAQAIKSKEDLKALSYGGAISRSFTRSPVKSRKKRHGIRRPKPEARTNSQISRRRNLTDTYT
jgi:hypothetical protein